MSDSTEWKPRTWLEQQFLEDKSRLEQQFQLRLKRIEEQPLRPMETEHDREKRILFEKLDLYVQSANNFERILVINQQLADIGVIEIPGWDTQCWTHYAEIIGHDVEDAKTNLGRFRIGEKMISLHRRGELKIPTKGMNDIREYGEFAELIRLAEVEGFPTKRLLLLKAVARAGGKLGLDEAREAASTPCEKSLLRHTKTEIKKFGWDIHREDNRIVLARSKQKPRPKK